MSEISEIHNTNLRQISDLIIPPQSILTRPKSKTQTRDVFLIQWSTSIALDSTKIQHTNSRRISDSMIHLNQSWLNQNTKHKLEMYFWFNDPPQSFSTQPKNKTQTQGPQDLARSLRSAVVTSTTTDSWGTQRNVELDSRKQRKEEAWEEEMEIRRKKRAPWL